MSTKTDDMMRMVERGERVAAIREALDMTGEEFAAEIQRVAYAAFHVTLPFDKAKVSRLERGKRQLTDEETAILTLIDPKHRTVAWLVFGKPGKVAIPSARARAASGEAKAG